MKKETPKFTKGNTEQLEELTFFPSESREMNDGIIPQIKPKQKDDFIMFFGDGKVIRIGCDEIILTVQK